jgi:hypothetical protein
MSTVTPLASYLTGGILTLVLPVGTFLAVIAWYAITLRAGRDKD